ncbi:MAG: TIGR01458 family HAD-type hydrolase [Chthoniobacteraceae bacterium]
MPLPERIAGFLIDLDGTVFEGDTLIPGAADALVVLAQKGIPYRLVTNTTSKPLSAIMEKLRRAGLALPREHVFSAPVIAREYCLQQGYTRCFPLLKQSLLEDLSGIEFVETAPEAVLIGDMGDDLTYAMLNQAFRCLLDGAAFVTMARNRYFKGRDGLCLDVGSIVAALEYATQREATLLGKPAAEFFLPALQSMGITAAQAAMIGDDLEADVAGAQAAGIAGILVRTGKFRPEQLQAGAFTPDRVLDSMADLPPLLG